MQLSCCFDWISTYSLHLFLTNRPDHYTVAYRRGASGSEVMILVMTLLTTPYASLTQHRCHWRYIGDVEANSIAMPSWIAIVIITFITM